ncbi:MAG TPA: hypothetical protein P5161_07180, partial [Eubacteriales bacterium]|nr:hypothetical protein [Eubacteriales bacterium]
ISKGFVHISSVGSVPEDAQRYSYDQNTGTYIADSEGEYIQTDANTIYDLSEILTSLLPGLLSSLGVEVDVLPSFALELGEKYSNLYGRLTASVNLADLFGLNASLSDGYAIVEAGAEYDESKSYYVVNQGEDGKYKFIPAAEPEVDYVVYDKVSYSYLNAPKNFYVQTETGYELAEFLFSAAYLNAMSASGKTVRRAVFTANTAIFDPAAVYFVLVDGKYTVADIEAFEAGITYYTITSFGPAIVAGTAFDRNAVYALYGTAEESYTLTELSPFDVIGDAEAVFYVARLNLNGAIYLTKTGLSATVYAKPGEDFAADKSYFAYSAEFGAYFLVPASKLFVKVEAGEPYSEHIRYYTFDAAAKSYKLAEIAAFEAGKTYYRGSFTALSADAAFNPLKNYFTYNEAGYYEYAAISAFDPEVTYYLI